MFVDACFLAFYCHNVCLSRNIQMKITITIPAAKQRRHFAPPVKVIPNKKKQSNKQACRK